MTCMRAPLAIAQASPQSSRPRTIGGGIAMVAVRMELQYFWSRSFFDHTLRRDQSAARSDQIEMMIGVAELRVDDREAFEVVADHRLHGHADAAMDLDRLLADETARASD